MSGLLQLPVGSVFASDFRVLRPLSEGGMGAVYVVEQLSTGRKRALKVMQPGLVSQEKLRERFTQEARVASLVESEHVVEVVGAGVDAATGTPWLAMELLEGETLAERVAREGALAPHVVRDLFEQLCHAIGAAHRAGIVHRDLKPENVFLAVSRRAGSGGGTLVKVLDFGIAKIVAEAKTAHTAAIGTPLWMAPEQTEVSAHITAAADVWALGLIAFHLLSGRYYWRAAAAEHASAMMLMREVCFEPIVPASQRAAELSGAPLPPAFDAWFDRCVRRDIAGRFANATDAGQALGAALAGPPAEFARTAPMPQPPVVAMTQPMPPAPISTTTGPSVASPPRLVDSLASEVAPPKSNAPLIAVGAGAVVVIAAGLIALGRGDAPKATASTDAAPVASEAGDDESLPPVERGKLLYATWGCSACHSLDGSKLAGPSWKGIWGREEVLSDDSKVVVDENYVRESILTPGAKVVKGYDAVMPVFKGQLDDAKIKALTAFIKAQAVEPTEPPPSTTAPPAPTPLASLTGQPPKPAPEPKPTPEPKPAPPAATGCAGYKGDYAAAMRGKEYECVRSILLPRLNSGTLSQSEARYLKAACNALGDNACAKRAAEHL